jgi:predicted small lipoprotein YifL
MKRPSEALVLGWALLAAAGCGRKGALELPYSRIPAPVEDLAVTQRGDRAILEWTNPGKNIDGHPPVDIESVEIWMIPEAPERTGSRPRPGDLEKRGRMITRLAREDVASLSKTDGPGSPRLVTSVPLEGIPPASGGRTFSLRIRANGGRLSEFSSPVSLEIRLCSLPPEEPAVTVTETFVEIRWSPPRANLDGTIPALIRGYTVYRSEEGRPPRRLTPESVTGLRFEDRDVRFGTALRYFVRTVSKAEGPYLESGDSEAVEVFPRDVFPPSVPEGLAGIAEGGYVSLSWKAGTESDLAGYRVWRREEGLSDDTLLTPEPVPGSVFRDTSGLENKVYLYSVSALDRSGNESGRSRPAVVRRKEGGR